MATDYNDYFISRISRGNSIDGDAKYAELQEASQNKITQLTQLKAAQQAQEAIDAASWVSQRQLDKNSILGQLTNLAASGYAGVSRGVGSLVAAPASLLAAANQANLSEEDKGALARHEQGQSTPEDLVRINRKVAPIVAPDPGLPREAGQAAANARAQAMADSNPNAPTPLSIWKEMNKARETSVAITESFDRGSVVLQDARNEFTAANSDTFNTNAPQVTKGWEAIQAGDTLAGSADVVSGVAKLLVGGLGNILSNKQATAEYITENLPQLFVGALGTPGRVAQVVDNVSGAATHYNKGIQDYQAKNGGELPPEEQRNRMALLAATHAAAEQAGDKIGLAAAKLGSRAVTDVSRTSFKAALRRTTVAAGEGLISEAPTEAYQQWAEGEILGKPATGAEIFNAGVIGGASGAGLSGGGRAVSEAAKLAAQPGTKKAPAEILTSPDEAKVQQAAIDSGDVTTLTDPKSPSYAPGMAVAALMGNSKKADTTPEQRQANIAKAAEIVSGLEDTLAEQTTYLSTFDEKRADIADLKEKIAALDPADPNKVRKTEIYQNSIKGIEEVLAGDPLTPFQIRAGVTKLSQIGSQLRLARKAQTQLDMVVNTPAHLDDHVATLSSPLDTKDAQAAGTHRVAAESVIILSMASPERLSPEVATQLADNTANGLSEAERGYLREFSKARIAANALRGIQDVSQEVMEGSKENKGIVQYQSGMARAIASGRQGAADKQLAGLANFMESHKSKTETLEAALLRGDGTQIHYNKDTRKFFIPTVAQMFTGTRREIDDALRKNGGLIARDTSTLDIAIAAESAALNTAYAALAAAYEMKFGDSAPASTATTGATNVSDQSQQGSGSQASSQASSEQATAQSGSNTTAASTGTTDVKPTGVVGSGVVEKTGVTTQSTPNTEEANASSVKTKDTEVSESTKNTGEEVKSTTEVVASGLSVLQGKKSTDELPAGTKLGAVYRTMNRVVAFLTQRTNKNSTDIATDRPLVSIPDFLSKWTKGEFHPSDLFAAELLEPEVGALNNFQGFAKKWAPLVRANLIKGGLPNSKGNLPTEAFKHEDPIQDFFNPDGSIDENVVTAIVYGAYAWLNDSVRGAAYKDKEAILKMHGLRPGEDIEISRDGYRALSQMSGFKDNAASSIGAYIIDALGFKANKEVTEEYMANLASAFGLHGLVLLAQEEVDLIDLVSIDGEQMQKYLIGSSFPAIGVNKKGDPIYPTMTYVRVRRDSEGDLLAPSQSIKAATAGSFGVVDGLFSTERGAQYASWKPVAYTQAMAKKTGQTIPAMLRRILEKSSQVPNRVIPAMYDLIGVLGDKNFLAAAGHIEYDERKIQKENLDSTLAKNSGLEEQLANTKSLVQNAIDFGGGIAQAFYVLPEVWRNFRVGSAASDLNLQTSKIQRFSFYRPEWESTINLQNDVSTTQFLVSIAQALGTKIDTKPNEDMLTAFMASTGQPDSQESKFAIAIHEALQTPDKDVMSAGMKQDIGVFAASKEGMQTLQALVMYGRYLDARNKFAASGNASDAKFTVQMVVGVDGKTNGPMLSFLAMGAAETKDALFSMLNRGGMYRDKDGAKNFNHWYERATSLDLYEHIAAKILEGIPATEGLNAIYTFTKSLTEGGKITSAGRNFAKSPMTPLTFGSSIDRSIGAMEEVFVQSVFDRIQAVADGSDKKTTRLALIKSLNLLMGTTIPESTPIEDLMARPFTKAEKLALANKFRSIIGGRIENAIGGVFNLFLQRRNALNKNIQGAFGVYDAVRQDMYNAEMELLMDSGDVAFRSDTDKVTGKVTRVPLHGMKAEQLEALKEKLDALLPRANTAYTAEANDLASGLAMSKTSVRTGERLANNVKIQLGRKIPSTGGSNGGKMVSHLLGASQERVEVSPGVAGFSYFIHSLDSFIMQTAIEDTHSLNVHDEAGNGVDKVIRTAKSINHATWTALLNFSPATEAYNMLVRTVEGAAALHKAGQLSPQGLANIEYTLRGMLPYKARSMPTGQLIMTVLRAAHKGQRDANIMRLDGMSEMFHLDQYTWEGGQYDVTDKDRDEALAKLKTARENSAVSEETQAAAEALTAAFMGKPKAESEVKPAASSVPDIQEDPIKVQSPFGELVAPGQKPDIEPDQDLVDYFKAKPVSQASEVMTMLGKSKKLSPANSKLLQLIYRTLSVVNPKLTVRYVTRGTEMTDVLAGPGVAGRGWYVSTVDGRTEIYIVGTDFKSSGLTAEVLLHEMVHAAIAQVIASPKTEAAKELVKELEALRTASLEYAQGQEGNLIQKYFAALSDIQEFVAWGMTNSDFQTEILNNVTFESQTVGNPLITAMAKFIVSIAKFLFQGMTQKQQDDSRDGLGVLLTNVSGLFNAAAESKIEKAAAPAKTETKVADVAPDAPFKLNEGQQAAYDAVVEFLKSTRGSFSVIGSAGTGKTTIVKTILENLAKEGVNNFSEIVLTSPTHRANAVTRSKNSGQKIVTLHSLLGLAPSVNLEGFDARNVKFARKDSEEGQKTMPIKGLLIVDESSMINDALFQVLMDEAQEAGTKVIFLGDMAQLGPVKQETDSQALTSTDGQAILNQVMRAKNAALLDESVALRESGDFTGTNSMKQGSGVQFTESGAAFIGRATKFFKSDEFKKNPLLVRVLAFRNSTVARYNKLIRAAIHGENAPVYVPGDLLMGYASYGKADEKTKMAKIANGVDYVVQTVGNRMPGTLYGVKVELITLVIKDVFGLNPSSTVQVVSPDTSPEKIKEIGIAAQKLIVAAKKDAKQWRKFYSEKEMFVLPFDIVADNGGQVQTLVVKTMDYGYAHTIHKSQGGTYRFVMVDANDVNVARTEKDRKRLRYVGLTRAEQGAFVLTDGQATDENVPFALNLSMASTQAAVDSYSTVDIHESLADATAPLGAAFDAQLRGLLGGIVDKLHGPFGAFKESMRKNEAGTPLDVWIKAVTTGKAPFASLIDGSPLSGSAQESFVSAQVEATVRAALDGKEARTKMVYADLSKLYAEMYRTLNKDGREFHGTGWATASPAEKAKAKAQYDFVFDLQKTNGDKMDHLARFAALGLANEKFNNVLKIATERDSKRLADAVSWADKFQAVFENVLEYFHDKYTRTFKGQRADDKLAVLIEQLVDIEAKERSHIATTLANRLLDPADDMVKKFSDKIRTKIGDVAGSGFIRDSKNSLVKVAGTVTRTVAGNRVDAVLENIRKMREQNFAGIQGVAASLMQEYHGHNKLFQYMLRMAKVTEGDRKDKIASFGKSSLSAFENEGKDISGRSDKAKGIRKAISAVFMRTGAHNLMGSFSLKEIENLVGDSKARDAAIATYEAKLNTFGGFKHYFIEQANVLAAYKATGSVRGAYLLMNAHVISTMVGTKYAVKITEAQALQAEDTIKVLIALYAIGYSDSKDLGYAKEILASENARTNGNGIEFVLDLHKNLEVESLVRLFQGDKTQMIHGYTSEIYDPRREVTTANVEDGKKLVAQGWEQSVRVSLDPADPDREEKHVYFLKDGGKSRRVTGILSYTGKNSKGTSIHNGYMNVNTAAGLQNAVTNAGVINSRQTAINNMFNPGPRKDLSKAGPSFMAPVLNTKGEAVKWRYLMSENLKDDLLKRDNRFDKVLGTVAGSIFDKETTQEQNMKAVKALREHYDTDYELNPKGYMLVGVDSTDPEMKEIWNLLPDDTKRDVEKVWGYKGMMVRSDNLDIMFGYRKLSIADVFDKDPDVRIYWEKVVVAMAEAAFGQKAALRMRQGERGWQEMVAEAKDIIVVKSGLVMLANIRSNMWLLHMNGVPLKDMLHHHLVALKGASSYQKESKELDHLKMLRDTGYTQGKDADIARRISLLEDSLARNPVKELIDAGLMPTIVEELDPDDDNYSYKSALANKVQSITDKGHPVFMDAAKFVYMAHDTPLYQGFRRVTQLSDFVARYTLYQHLISKKDAPMSKPDAIQEASDAFVNYDIPMHRMLQYTDDMGLTMFTKYFIRIQKVLANTVRDNPGRVITSTLLSHYLGLGSTVLEESSMWMKIGNNPIKDGPLTFLESLGELPVLNSAMSVFSAGVAAPAIDAAVKATGLPS